MTANLDLLVGGVDFGEGPRWHAGELWYSDFYQRAVYRVAADGTRTVAHDEFADRPGGLGWMPDGSLLVVSMTERKLLREVDGAFVLHADLSDLATGHCNDMVVDVHGNAYIGNFGFDLEGGAEAAPTRLILVRPDGTTEAVGDDLVFPNGTVITPDGRTLIVGETFGAGYTAYTIADDATLTEPRRWADVPGMYPDGCSLDTEGGIWFSDAGGSQVVRVTEGGTVTDRIATPMPTFACMLGGDDGTTLHILCSPGSHPDEVAGKAGGAIYMVSVAHPRAGRP